MYENKWGKMKQPFAYANDQTCRRMTDVGEFREPMYVTTKHPYLSDKSYGPHWLSTTRWRLHDAISHITCINDLCACHWRSSGSDTQRQPMDYKSFRALHWGEYPPQALMIPGGRNDSWNGIPMSTDMKTPNYAVDNFTIIKRWLSYLEVMTKMKTLQWTPDQYRLE